MILALETCRLRPWRPEDAADLARNADDPDIARNMRDAFPSPYTLADARRWLESVCSQEPVRFFAIEVEGEAAGGIGITPLGDIYRRAGEIGYWLARRFWNRGIVTEAVAAITSYAFTTLDLTRVQTGVLAWNTASLRVLEKCGYEREGLQRRGAFKDGRTVDLVLYARLRPEP